MYENYNHLLANLLPIKEKSPYPKSTRLLKLQSGNYKKWLYGQLLPNTRLIIEPKINGYQIILIYKNGILQEAFHNKKVLGLDRVQIIKTIPNEIPISKEIAVRGELYKHRLNSQRTRLETIRITSPNEKSLSFCCYQLINCNLNHNTELQELKNLGFSIPETDFTRFTTSEVDLYLNLWQNGILFNNYPAEGLVIKVNSKRLQKQLGHSNHYVNWAYLLK